MIGVRLFLRWAPLVAIAIGLWRLDGWIAAASFAGVALMVRKHIVLAAVAAVLLVWLAHVPYIVMIEGAAYGLLWVPLIGAAFQLIVDRPPRPASVVPRLRCGHGLQQRIAAADQALQQRFGAAALDGYLAVIAGHPVGGCDRALYLRSAEAAVLAGNAPLATELADAAVRDVQGEPVGQLATILVRAHAIKAQGCLLLKDVEGATRAIRTAQRGTQADRNTDGYLRWAAADVSIAAKPAKSADEVSDDFAAAITRQRVSVRPNEALGRCLLTTASRALDAGHPQSAIDLATTALSMVQLGNRLVQALVETGKRRIPRRRVTAWQLYRDAVTLQIAAATQMGSQRDVLDEEQVSRAACAAPQLDDPWAAARLMFEQARWSLGAGKANAAAGLLRRALDLGDYRLHTFSDPARQADWIAARSQIATTLGEITGEPGQGLGQAWPSTPAHLERRQAAAVAALELFERLRQRDPDVFSAGYARVLATVSGRPPVAPAPVARPVSALMAVPEVVTEAVPEQVPQAAIARSNAVPGPTWLRELLASGPGERCWTVYQAFLLAQEMGHGHVGPEHLVPALVAERPIDSLIAEFATSPAELRAAVGARFAALGTTPELDPRLERLLPAAAAEAARWGERRVRPAWLMLAMLREPASAGTALLQSHGVDRHELLVRLLATTVSSSPPVRAPLFAIDDLVGPHRLTAPARLALTGAVDFAAAESGLLGADHIRAAARQYDWAACSPEIAGARSTREQVKVTGSARTALRTALHLARSQGISGVSLDHLRRATGADERPHKEFSPAFRAVIRAAHGRAASRQRSYLHLADLKWALEQKNAQPASDACFGLPAVLTPQVMQAISAAEHAAADRVDVDDLRTALAPMRATR